MATKKWPTVQPEQDVPQPKTITKANIPEYVRKMGGGLGLLAQIANQGIPLAKKPAEVTIEGEGKSTNVETYNKDDYEKVRQEYVKEMETKQKTLLTMIPVDQNHPILVKNRQRNEERKKQEESKAKENVQVIAPPTVEVSKNSEGLVDYRSVLKKANENKKLQESREAELRLQEENRKNKELDLKKRELEKQKMEEEKRKQEEERKRKEEAEKRLEEELKKKEEEKKRKEEEENKRKEEEENKRREEEEKKKQEEENKRREEEEKKRIEEEKKKQEEEKKKREEEERIKNEEEEKKKQEEKASKKPKKSKSKKSLKKKSINKKSPRKDTDNVESKVEEENKPVDETPKEEETKVEEPEKETIITETPKEEETKVEKPEQEAITTETPKEEETKVEEPEQEAITTEAPKEEETKIVEEVKQEETNVAEIPKKEETKPAEETLKEEETKKEEIEAPKEEENKPAEETKQETPKEQVNKPVEVKAKTTPTKIEIKNEKTTQSKQATSQTSLNTKKIVAKRPGKVSQSLLNRLSFFESITQNCEPPKVIPTSPRIRSNSKPKVVEAHAPFYNSNETYIANNPVVENKEKGPFFSYEELLKHPVNLVRTQLEAYLSDEEFEKVFLLKKSEFYSLPKWKQIDLKRNVKLF